MPTCGVLRVGIIGCGRAAEQLHLPALRTVPEAEVTALADLDPDRLERLAERFHVPRRRRDYVELVNDPAVDVVAVCVPTPLHAEVVLTALDAGKHVFVEKPIALTRADADRMVDRAARAARCCTVGFNLRCHRLVDDARRIILSGTLGEIELIRTAWTSHSLYGHEVPAWRGQRAQGGGAVLEVAVHHADLWRHLTASEVESVFAHTRSQISEDQTAVVNARLSNGALVTAGFSQRTADANEIEVYGQRAQLAFSLYRADSLIVQPISDLGGGPRVRMKRLAQRIRTMPAVLRAARVGGDYLDSYRREWMRFLSGIRGDGSAASTFEDGRKALEIVLAMIESAERGCPITVDSVPRGTVRE